VYGEISWTHRSEAHVARHGLTPYEVDEAVRNRPRVIRFHRGVQMVLCRTSSGRYICVLLAEGEDGRDFVVTARDMTDVEKREYRRKAR
jgi:hypothetical protein